VVMTVWVPAASAIAPDAVFDATVVPSIVMVALASAAYGVTFTDAVALGTFAV
jgi:hypothetical protein